MVDKQGLHINGVLYDVQYYINRNGCGIKSRLGFGLSSQNLGILKGESKFGGDYVPADGVSQAEYDSQLKKYEKALNSFDKKKSFWHKKSLKQEQLYPDLQGTYHVWDFVRIIEDQALQGKTHLTSVILPELLESIGRSAFEDCSNLSTINLPSSLEYIGPSAFRGCSRLKSVSIPKGIKSI